MVGIRSPTNCQANGLNHSSRGQRPRKTPLYLFRPVRAIQRLYPDKQIKLLNGSSHHKGRSAPLRRDMRVLREKTAPSLQPEPPKNQKSLFSAIFQSRLGHAKSRQVAASPEVLRNYIFYFYALPPKTVHKSHAVIAYQSYSSHLSRRSSLCLCTSVAKIQKIKGIKLKSGRIKPKNLKQAGAGNLSHPESEHHRHACRLQTAPNYANLW
jgi:hypothetical protein